MERGAREHDARASAEAFEKGNKPPKPTEGAAKEALALAQRSRDLSGRAADQALGRLHDLIVANRDAWMPAVQAAVDQATADVQEQITRLEQALVRQGELAAVERGLRRFDAATESPKVRMLQQVGRPGRRGDQVEDSLAKLVEGVQARADRPVEPTDEERQAAEELQERARGLRQMASGRGGVHVPGV